MLALASRREGNVSGSTASVDHVGAAASVWPNLEVRKPICVEVFRMKRISDSREVCVITSVLYVHAEEW